jgi:hypothetical protein
MVINIINADTLDRLRNACYRAPESPSVSFVLTPFYCNPSYWEARIVGWLMGGKTSAPAAEGFCSRTKAAHKMV